MEYDKIGFGGYHEEYQEDIINGGEEGIYLDLAGRSIFIAEEEKEIVICFAIVLIDEMGMKDHFFTRWTFTSTGNGTTNTTNWVEIITKITTEDDGVGKEDSYCDAIFG